MTLGLVIAAVVVAALSGPATLALPRRGLLRDRVFAALMSQTIVLLLQWALIPRRQMPSASGVFPAPTRLETETPDVVLDRGVVPALKAAAGVALWVRLLQQGKIQVYVLYILLALLLLLLIA